MMAMMIMKMTAETLDDILIWERSEMEMCVGIIYDEI